MRMKKYGMIYALGCALESDADILPGCKGNGVFERYDPSSDLWQVLPDPPLPIFQWKGANFMDRVTVVGRRVFIDSCIDVIFNLDNQDWDPLPPSELAVNSPWLFSRRIIQQKVRCFPYSSLFIHDSFYHLTGHGAWKPGTTRIPGCSFGEPLKIVKKGPVTTTKDRSLLKDPCLDLGKEQIMAKGIDLDENKPFFESDNRPWRELIHMGGRFFCYVVTAQLFGCSDDHQAHGDPYSRAVLIKFFEEVPAHTDNNIYNKTKFRPLASFCYKIITNFRNPSFFIRCSVIGTVPESWIIAQPLKKRQESKLNYGNNEQDDLKKLLPCKSELLLPASFYVV